MQDEQTNVFFRIIKGVGVALALSFLGAVIMASVLSTTSLPDKVIYPINQTLKVLAIAIGTLLFVREEKGLLQGVAIGALFTMLSYLTFSALGGDFSLSWWIVGELALAVFAGGICGAIAINLKNRA